MKRIISKLDIKGRNLVKGVNLEGLRALGEPSIFAQNYSKNMVDEIIYHDCVASLYERKSFVNLLKNPSFNVFIPVSVGWGIKDIKDIEEALSAGADKVFINSSALKRPKFLNEASKRFGSANICLSIESIKDFNGNFICMSNYGRDYSNKKLLEWIIEAQDLGIGEIILTSVNNDGMMNGFDIELVSKVEKIINVPIVVSGGGGEPDHFKELFSKTNIEAVAAASIFHFTRFTPRDLKLAIKSVGRPVRIIKEPFIPHNN